MEFLDIHKRMQPNSGSIWIEEFEQSFQKTRSNDWVKLQAKNRKDFFILYIECGPQKLQSGLSSFFMAAHNIFTNKNWIDKQENRKSKAEVELVGLEL